MPGRRRRAKDPRRRQVDGRRALFVPDVAAEIVVEGDIGRITLHADRPIVVGREHRFEEGELVGPGRFRLGAAIAWIPYVKIVITIS
jgi:hypothetical protein